MALSLPANPDLERFRRDARALQRAVRSARPDAVDHVARLHPSGAPDDPTTFALADAQLVLARTYGFASWPRLRAYLRVAAPLTRDPGALDPTTAAGGEGPHPDGSPSAVAALACLTYSGDDEPDRWARAARMLDADPSLVARGVVVAAVAGDPDALRTHLAADPAAATREDGPFRWPPLLYLVYSRVPQRDPVAAARLLLDAEADPDSGYLWQGLPTPFTALTGVLGEGESGPARQPRHPQWRALAGLLLDRGADPNDRQALYNRMFGRDDSHLELLLARGLGRPASEVWTRRLGVTAETVEEMLARQVAWARDHGFAGRLDLFVAHGLADPSVATDLPPVRVPAGRTALHEAAFMDDVEQVRALLSAGADPEARDAVHGTRPYEWARWARADEAAAVLREVTTGVADAD
ncbi:ankyrin repeat domain-containing protein [Intrasporangium flavum]|uniref:ankyrin repeat domain-containing protein n=1 Tax=Intrasporangium flavum TaxID=1428657 RepID=UPI00096DEEB1|nr:ankyrin repeat domain-containing protein [Intrasporangium flavum]